MKEPQKLFALWRYSGGVGDGETLLGSPVASFTASGLIVAEGYGGATFKPTLILPFDAGKKAFAEFNALRIARRAAYEAFTKEWDAAYKTLRRKYEP